MTAILIMTVGRTDVQLLVDGKRKQFGDRSCARLHDALASRKDWSIGDSHVPKATGGWDDDLPEGPFSLATPKLDAILDRCVNEEIGSALIFDTQRKGDPHQAGEIVARRLKEVRSLQAKVVPFLTASASKRETLENPGSPGEEIVRRSVVKLVEEAVRKALSEAKLNKIILHTTGGLPAFNALLEELVRLHAGELPVDSFEVPDAERIGREIDQAVPRALSPAVSFQARHRALALLREGHLLASWGAASHLEGVPQERSWVRILDWVRRWAASRPLQDDGAPEECDIDVLLDTRRAVRAALRVEFALMAGDVPDAVHGTVAFFEAALEDHLELKRTALDGEARVFSFCPAPPNKLVRKTDEEIDKGSEAFTPNKKEKAREDNRKRPFVPFTPKEKPDENTGSTQYYRLETAAVCAQRLAKYYLETTSLEAYGNALSHKPEGKISIRQLRNDVAHAHPTPALIKSAHARMRDQGLWSGKEPEDHARFLCQDLVQAVLVELNVGEPAGLADRLISEVESRLTTRMATEPA